jgi:thiol-disulfide isomerase/thioredoxin
VEKVVILGVVLLLAIGYGYWYRHRDGQVKARSASVNRLRIEPTEIGSLGERATLLQFSSAFCTPCRATRVILAEVAAQSPGVRHIDVDAEHQLELVRKVGILSTPTTLILDSKGYEVARAVGAPRKAQVVASLDAIA